MVREVCEDPAGALTRALERLADAQVELGAPCAAETVVQRLAHQLVREAIGEPARRQLLDHPAADALVEGRQELGILETCGSEDDVELELRPHGRRQLEQVRRLGREAREALADHLANALGCSELRDRPRERDRAVDHLDRAGLDERPPKLVDEKRVSFGEVADRPRQVAEPFARIGSCRAPHKLHHVVAGQAAEPQADDVLGSAEIGERLRERARHVGLAVAERGQQEQARITAGPSEVPEEQQGRSVGPVSVLDDQKHGTHFGDSRQELRDRRVQAMALGVGVCLDGWRQLAGALGQMREQPRELTASHAERRTQLVRLDRPRQAVERLHERTVRSAHHLVAGAVQDEHAGARRVDCELAHEPALAGAGLAADEDDAALLAGGRGHERAEELELGRASDERRGRRETERAEEIGHHTTIVRPDYRAGRSGGKSGSTRVMTSRPTGPSLDLDASDPDKGEGMSTISTPAQAARRELSGFGGRLIGPDDAEYDEARSVHNGMIDKRPALIARPTTPDEVAQVVAFARDNDLLLAIRGGGHNGAGLGTVDDGVVIDLSLLKGSRSICRRAPCASVEAAPGARSTPRRTSTGSRRRAGSSRPRESAA
jgi:hypothetical protein